MFTTVSMYPRKKFQYDVVIEYHIETNIKHFEIYQKIYSEKAFLKRLAVGT